MALGISGKQKQQEARPIDPHELITTAQVEMIRKALIDTHADLVVRGMMDRAVRDQLEDIVAKDYTADTKGNPEIVKYVVRETIGTGVIEEILQDKSVTDINYNGKELIIESNDRKTVFDSSFQITEDYILRLVNKFASANDKEFTSKHPIFDGRFENVRINAVHSQNTAPESGTTMSLRVVRPRLALTEKNFDAFAPLFVLDLLGSAVKTRANMVISGTTGTGKTELHKLMSKYVPFTDRIILIEDTPETFMKQMFPEKDIYSWVTSESVSTTDLVKAAMRNHGAWVMVTETRSQEAYEMISAVLSGHSIITSLHAINARAIPSRLVNMAKMGYDVSEESLLDDIRRHFQFGIHIKKVRYQGQVVRYLSEIVEFNPDGERTVFKQRFVDGVYRFETFELSEEFIEMMEDQGVTVDWPEPFRAERVVDFKDLPYETRIPLDTTGRPDHAALEKMGTTLGILMGRERPAWDSSDADSEPLEYNVTREGYMVPDFNNAGGDNIVNRKVESAKKRVLESEKRSYKKNRQTQAVDDDLEDDLQRILDAVKEVPDDTTNKPVIPPSYHNRPKVRRKSIDELQQKPKSTQELIDATRKSLMDQDV